MSDTFLNPVTTQTWANGRHIVRCVKVIQETWDVRTFCFMADQPIMFFFKPGQFVTLELEIEGKPVMRSYTISSSPSVPYSFSITVKRVPGGLVSNFLHDTMHEGLEVPV
ncbi:glycine-betaine demethylase subunit GbcB, partial [Klebsiella pneumoniae]|nr:glycine-betaine demethylase subunit GbcB [Klebsiella pneumoniae]